MRPSNNQSRLKKASGDRSNPGLKLHLVVLSNTSIRAMEWLMFQLMT